MSMQFGSGEWEILVTLGLFKTPVAKLAIGAAFRLFLGLIMGGGNVIGGKKRKEC